MSDAPRVIRLTVELRYDPTLEEQAVFDSEDEAAQAELDQAVLKDILDLLEHSELAASRFRVGLVQRSTGSSWINRLHS